MPVNTASNTRRGIRPLLLVPLVLVAALIGYLIATSNHDDATSTSAAKVAGAAKVTRDSGDSVLRSHDGSGAVNLRSCPGLPTAGQTTGCDIIDRFSDGTVVTMECWIDSGAVPGRADTDRRWFLVTPGAGAPHPGRRGYVFSAEIPVEEQVRTSWCSNDLINELITEPQPVISPSKASPPAATPSAASPTPSSPAVITDSPTTETPTSSRPVAPATIRVTLDNRVTNGETQMREDTDHPAYLSTRPVRKCKAQQPACNVPGDLTSGDRLSALCQTTGERITNGQDYNNVDNSNPGLDESTLWYRLRAPDGRTGYLSVIWLVGSDRSGLGLPTC
ncbi:hypothetical protein OHB35_15725 [Streptomyces phaeochromogenes]|uniref:SH3 domain-containing protein n=1 Tax=Streptomyces phaeochromogenes TaxID=1923 RepID=A0ABZ1H7N3_STRPH|nr:hypothetical protein [Streptomyces phaeochromogenes]WSD14577.1 hypothetical protein OHB35_15725 [Streptomyces phaeochromogenes]